MKRALSLMLSLCLLMSMLPGGVAEEVFEEQFAEDSFVEGLAEEDSEMLAFPEDLPEAAAFEEEAFTEDAFEEESFAGLPDDGAASDDSFTEEIFGEESFGEESFEETAAAVEAEEVQPPVEESAEVFAEEEQFVAESAEDAAVAVQPADDTQEILIASELEDRSVVSMVTDQVEGESSAFADNAKTYWKVAPTVNVIQPKADGVPVDGQIKIRWVSEWNVDKTVLPANVKYYVYRVDPKTGVATQVKTAAAKAISFTQDGRKVSGTGSAVTLNGMKGDEIFYVRAEKITSGNEVYGLSSELVYLADCLPEFENGLWKTVTIRSLSEYTDKWDDEGNLSLVRLRAEWNCGGVTSQDGVDGLDFIVKLTYQDKDGNRKGTAKVIKDFSQDETGRFFIEQSEEEVEAYTDLGATHVKLTVQAKKDGVKGTVASKTIQLSSDGTSYKKLVGLSGSQSGDNLVMLTIDPNRLTHQYIIKGLLTDEKLMYDQEAGTMYPKNPAAKSCIQHIYFHYSTVTGEEYEWGCENTGTEFQTFAFGSPDLLSQKGVAWISVEGKTKEAASVTVTVQPIKKTSTKAIQGEIHTVVIPMVNSWRTKPVITGLKQTGIREATLCFTQNQNQVRPTAFIVYGFKAKAVVKVVNGELTLPAATTGVTAVETIKQEDGTYLYKMTGAVAAEGESTFTVQPQLTVDGAKQSGEKSDAAKLNVLAKTKTGVLKLAIGPWKDDGSGVTGSVTVTFASIQPKTNVEKFVVSLADADSFAGADAYKKKITLTYKQEKDADGNGYDDDDRLYHAVFTGVEKGKTYSALAETFTVDAGRLVDKTLSLVYGESPKDEKIAEKPDTEPFVSNIRTLADGTDAAGNSVFIGTEVNMKDIVGAESFDIVIDEEQVEEFPKYGTYTLSMVPGEHTVRVRLTDVQTGEKGAWSDPFTLAVYADLTPISAEAMYGSEILLGSSFVLNAETQGGSRSYTYRLSVSAEGQEGTQQYEGTEFIPASSGNYTITVEVFDSNLRRNGKPLSATFEEPILVTVGDTFTVGDLTYRLKEEDPTKVMVSAYSGSETEVIVPATATEEASGRSFAVTEIGEKAFFENTSLTAITLPNAIEVIGVSAFEGCTSLATMNSVDNP